MTPWFGQSDVKWWRHRNQPLHVEQVPKSLKQIWMWKTMIHSFFNKDDNQQSSLSSTSKALTAFSLLCFEIAGDQTHRTSQTPGKKRLAKSTRLYQYCHTVPAAAQRGDLQRLWMDCIYCIVCISKTIWWSQCESYPFISLAHNVRHKLSNSEFPMKTCGVDIGKLRYFVVESKLVNESICLKWSENVWVTTNWGAYEVLVARTQLCRPL